MAQIAYIGTGGNGGRVLSALQQIRSGVATLQELDNLRANSIGESQAIMAQNFGAASNTDAQILSDRWSAFLALWENEADSTYAVLRDMVSATTQAP
jgi:hypothetical protein